MPDLATIAPRFNGPPRSGNGGYTCGILGSLIGDTAEVTLRVPPPLETPLDVARDDEGAWLLKDGDTVVASGRAAELDIEIPEPVDYNAAVAAESGFSGYEHHPFPCCFVCGPDRDERDGLRLFPGPVEGRNLVASHWLPEFDVAGEFGAASTRIVWAALDCPSYFGGLLAGNDRHAVLGRMTAKLVSPVAIDKPHVVSAWPLDAGERKWQGGSAIHDADGNLKAFAQATWVVIPKDHAGFTP